MPRSLPVYLIHWNAPEWCGSAAHSLLASEGVDVDLTVVDNGQSGGPALDDLLPDRVRVLPTPFNVGYAGAANIGLSDWLSHSPASDFCVVGSHDLHVEPTTLARLVDDAMLNPRCGILGPTLIGPHRSSGGFWNGRHAYQVSPPDGHQLLTRDWIRGTCLLLRRACVEQIGGFDESFGSYVEDVDLGLRANRQGWSVIVDPDARAWGLGTATNDWIARIATNTVRLAYKNRGVVGALDTISLFVWWIVRGYMASVWPGRSHEQRRLSRDYARQRTLGLIRLAGLDASQHSQR